MHTLLISHIENSDPPAFSVERPGGKRAPAAVVPSPVGFSVQGRPQSDLLGELRWYLETFLDYPFSPETEHAERVRQALHAWGEQAFNALFNHREAAVMLAAATALGYEKLHLQIRSDDPAILAWPWEALRDPQASTLAATCRIERCLNRIADPIALSTDLPQDRVNILLLTARPYLQDVRYRSISRPLVELIEKKNLPARVHVLRPPTLERLREHLAALGPGGEDDAQKKLEATLRLAERTVPEDLRPLLLPLGLHEQYVSGKSLAISEKKGDAHLAATTYHQLGTVAREQGDFGAAEAWYRKSLAICEKQGNEHGAAITYGQLGILAGFQAHWEDSGRWLVRSVIGFLRCNDPEEVRRNVSNLLIFYNHAPASEQDKLRAIWQEAGLGEFPSETNPNPPHEHPTHYHDPDPEWPRQPIDTPRRHARPPIGRRDRGNGGSLREAAWTKAACAAAVVRGSVADGPRSGLAS